MGLALRAGMGAEAMASRLGKAGAWTALGLVLLDALLLGGASLTLPTTALPDAPCLAEIPRGGAVLLWPDDATDGWPGPAQLLQLQHGHPAAHRGIASWKLHKREVRDRLRGAGLSLQGGPELDLPGLRSLGYDWLIARIGEEIPTLPPKLGALPVTSACAGIEVRALSGE